MRKLHIRTFGCQMNEYDTAKMADVLKASHGLELTGIDTEDFKHLFSARTRSGLDGKPRAPLRG